MHVINMEVLPDAADSQSSREQYYYQPLHTASSVYDTDIKENSSDLDSGDRIAMRRFRTRSGREEIRVRGDEEYDADDEEVRPSVESMDVDVGSAGGLAAVTEGEGGDDVYQHTLGFRRYMTSEPSRDLEGGSDARQQTRANGGFPEPSSSDSYDSNFSHLPCWTRRDIRRDRQGPDEEMSNVSRSQTSIQDPLPAPGTQEYFENFADAGHYPDAAQFFAVEFSTGFFANPFTTPPSGDSGGARSKSPPSPLTRQNDYGLLENWAFIPRDRSGSPVSTLSSYSQNEDRGSPVSPLSANSRKRERRGAVGLGISTAVGTFEPMAGMSPFRSISSGSRMVPLITSDLITQLDDLLFEEAAYEFFSRMDVEALVADQKSSAYTIEDHDDLHDDWNLDQKWPFRNFLPHPPSRRCHCHWCIEYYTPNSDDEMHHPHDFNPRCSCPVCKTFGCMLEIQRAAERQVIRDRELEQMRARKRKRQKSESRQSVMLVPDEQGARQQLSREICKVFDAQEDDEAEALMVDESRRTFREEEGDALANLGRFLGKETSEVTGSESSNERGDKTKKQCLGLYGWIWQYLRGPETD